MNQLPAHLQNRQRRDLASQAVGGISAGSPAHISIAGNRFTLVDDAGNEKPIQTLNLDICVIDANQSVSKIFFDPKIPFVPGGDNSNPPICWSDNGIGASAQASQPQNASCQLCPQNAWGSKVNAQTGTQIKACSDVKKLAVLVPGMDMVFLLRIPPASLKNWGKYCNTLVGHGVDLPDALTRLEFESQGVLKFSPVGYVDEATAALTDKAIAAKATDVMLGRNDRPWGGQAEAAKIAYVNQANNWPPPVAPAAQPMAPPPQQPFGNNMNNMAGVAAQPPFGAPTPPFAQAGTSSPTGATPPKRGRGPNKPKAEATPASPPSTPSPDGLDQGIPPFLRRNPEPVAPPAPNPTQFGMQAAPPAPDDAVKRALDDAFRLPT